MNITKRYSLALIRLKFRGEEEKNEILNKYLNGKPLALKKFTNANYNYEMYVLKELTLFYL